MLRIQRIRRPTVYRRQDQQQNSQHPVILFEQFLLHEGPLPHRVFRRWSGQRMSARPAICAGKDNSWDLEWNLIRGSLRARKGWERRLKCALTHKMRIDALKYQGLPLRETPSRETRSRHNL